MGHLETNRPHRATRPRTSGQSLRFRLRGSALGLTAANPDDLIRQLERGFSFKTLQSLESRSGLALPRLAGIIGIPERTLARRKVSRRLTPEESERLLRISSVFEDAVDLFEGDVSAASFAEARARASGLAREIAAHLDDGHRARGTYRRPQCASYAT